MDCQLKFHSYFIRKEYLDLKDRMYVGEDVMHTKENTLILIKSVLLLFLVQLSFACSGVNPMSPGAWVEEKNRVPVLQDGQQKGSWQTPDLTIEYELTKEANRLQISGVVDFGAYITKGFSTLEYLYIYIHVLKDDGIVLKTIPVKTFGYRRNLDFMGKMSFNGHFDMSADVDIVAVAFSYSGTVMDGGGRTKWDFWKVPHRKPPA
jgi:hypothetical protein